MYEIFSLEVSFFTASFQRQGMLLGEDFLATIMGFGGESGRDSGLKAFHYTQRSQLGLLLKAVNTTRRMMALFRTFICLLRWNSGVMA